MRRLIDTHSHIFTEEFGNDLDDVVKRAVEVGVDTFVMPNINLESVNDMLRVAAMYPGMCHACMGLHPTELKDDYREELAAMKRLLDADRSESGARAFCAVGESGLDLYWEQDDLKRQQEVFEEQIGWAIEYGLPLIIHARAAFEQLCSIMDIYRNTSLRGVFHCFSGGRDEALRLMEYQGFMFGIGGVSTYRKTDLGESLPVIPRDRIVTETDCPYLPPVPYRGSRNEPSYMIKTVEKLALAWGVTIDEAAEVTVSNARRLFGIQ
ncbi:MAG: TatD family hydrolase [Bacteroidaceae bacterium]|nr:TatD family hydrolase [Bacteroidaceae bacterium]